MTQTTMARETEAEGDVAVSLPPELESALDQEQSQETGEEEPTTEVEDSQSQSEEDAQAESEQAETLSPRGEKRVGKLLSKLKERTDERNGLRAMLHPQQEVAPQQNANQMPFGTPPWEQPQYGQLPQLGDEVTPEQYQAHVAMMAGNIAKAEVNHLKSELHKADQLGRDARDVESRYSLLNPDSDEYNSKLDGVIADYYQKARAADPSLRLTKFVDDFMSSYQEGQSRGKEQEYERVSRQVAQGAVTPSGSGQQSKSDGPKDFDSMSTSEKESWLKQHGYWD